MNTKPALLPIMDVARAAGLGEADIVPIGRYMAKLELAAVERLGQRPGGRLVLVSAINPTRAGEGKTTVSIGLGQGLKKRGQKVVLALREPSLGPVFGAKGGGTGGGRAMLEPSARINLHFTGDKHAVGAAHNLLAALVDNALHFGREPVLDARRVDWRRVVDMNDRFLRHVVIGLGGSGNGIPREAAFDITAASEVMAVLCLADGIADLKERLGRILVGMDVGGAPVTAGQIGAVGAMAALLHDAIKPNLVQAAEGVPALVHGGPFGNIAHGCSSVLGTRTALALADYAVTEAGFGFDLGAEKFFDIKCRSAGLWPHAVVLVVTRRAIEAHGAGDLGRGLDHLDQHIANVRRFGFDPVVAINVFDDDGEPDLVRLEREVDARGLPVARVRAFSQGGSGSVELARLVETACDHPRGEPRFLYPLDAPVEEKIGAIARTIYGARAIELAPRARADVARVRALGFAQLPICIAKTHLSLSGDPTAVGRPRDHVLSIAEVRVAAGAGYLLALAGDMLTMPGLPRHPAAHRIDLDASGEVTGI